MPVAGTQPPVYSYSACARAKATLDWTALEGHLCRTYFHAKMLQAWRNTTIGKIAYLVRGCANRVCGAQYQMAGLTGLLLRCAQLYLTGMISVLGSQHFVIATLILRVLLIIIGT